MELQEISNHQNNLWERRTKLEDSTPDFKTYYKGTVIKTELNSHHLTQHPTPRYVHHRNENIHPHKKLYSSCVIYNSQNNNPDIHKLRRNKCGVSIWWSVVWLAKKNKVLIHAKNTDEPRKKKPVTKTTYHKVPLVWDIWNRQIYRDRKSTSSHLGLEELWLGGWELKGTGLFLLGEKMFYNWSWWVTPYKCTTKLLNYTV